MIFFFFFRKAKDSCGRDVWLTNETYWKLRDNPGFANIENITVWWWDDTDNQHQTQERDRLISIRGGYFDSMYEPLWLTCRVEMLLVSSCSFCAPMTGSWERSAPGRPIRPSSTGEELSHHDQFSNAFKREILDYFNQHVYIFEDFTVFCRKEWMCDAHSADFEMKIAFLYQVSKRPITLEC